VTGGGGPTSMGTLEVIDVVLTQVTKVFMINKANPRQKARQG
jgi:hypothetical protein